MLVVLCCAALCCAVILCCAAVLCNVALALLWCCGVLVGWLVGLLIIGVLVCFGVLLLFVFLFVCVCSLFLALLFLCICSKSLPRGNQVDGLPRASHKNKVLRNLTGRITSYLKDLFNISYLSLTLYHMIFHHTFLFFENRPIFSLVEKGQSFF